MGLKSKVINLFSSTPVPTNKTFYNFYSAPETLSNTVTIESDKPISKKTTPTLPMVDKAQLEAAYKCEPTIFNAINKTTQLIMAAGYRLLGDDEESVKFFTDFFDSIGSQGGELEWEELLNSVFKHQMIYGEAWNELIPAIGDSKIVDIDLIDPKKMDYAKDSNDKIVLDKWGDPVGYVETLPFDYSADSKYLAPKEAVIQPNQIFFPVDNIAHYKLYTVGDGFYGIGMIEPSYNMILRKLNMEEALANALNRVGFPTRRVKVGDLNHEPTEEQVRNAATDIKNMSYMGVTSHPYWVDVFLDEAQHPEKLQEQLNYFIAQIVTGSGLPAALATGKGEETNRATLNRQEALAKLTLKDIVRRTTRIISKNIIIPVAKANNVNPVKISWGEISIEELDGKAKRLEAYVKSGLLTPDKLIEDLIRKYEELPKRETNGNTGTWKQTK